MLYQYFSKIMAERTRRDHQARFDQIVAELDGVYEEATRYAQQISIDSSVQALLSRVDYPSVTEELNAKRNVNNYLAGMQMLAQTIDSLALVKDGEVVTWTDVPFYDDQSRALCQDWYSEFQNALGGAGDGTQAVSCPYSFSFASHKGEQQMNLISVQVPLYSMTAAGRRGGSLIVNINVDTLEQILRKGEESFESLAYFSGGQELVLPQGGGQASREALRDVAQMGVGEQGEGFSAYFCKKTALGGTLVGMMDAPGLLEGAWPTVRSMLPVLFMAGTLVALLLIPVMLYLTRPVRVLADAMQQVGNGRMDTHVEIHTNDEFEVLGHELNRMVRQLNSFLQATLKNEKDKHELEYEVLVAQINPHFIYNTLNTVIYLAKKGKSQDVVCITKALIDLLQDGIKLSDNKNFSTVEEELWIIGNYICIQNYRYQDKFQLIVQCPEELKKRQVPSSVIQPLVENALFHGIVPLDRPGKIYLELARETREGAEWLRIRVADDGVGVPQEKLRAIMEGELKPTEVSRNHVGVQNIIKRLSLLYGERYEMTMRSEEGQGTQVEIVFPEQM